MPINSIELIKQLSNARGVSGFEDEVLDIVRKQGRSIPGLVIKEDTLRNCFLYPRKIDPDLPTCLLDAHADEVGFMVKSILANGMIKILPVGGWFSQSLLAHSVLVRNRDDHYIPGVIAAKPIHFLSAEERKKVLTIDDMFVDIGASSADEVINDYQIEIGAPIVPEAGFSFDEKHGIMRGKAFDDRIGCALVLEIISQLSSDLKVNIIGSLTSQEELGLRGITAAVETIKPDVAIALEGAPSDDTWVDQQSAQAALKKGAQIRHRDNSMIANPRFVKFARRIARQKEIPFQDAAKISGGTNAGKIHLAAGGIPSIVISVPVRYIHSHYGFCALEDYQGAKQWVIEIIRQLSREQIALF